MGEVLYSIGQVAACFGLRVSALRYYDELGLLSPARRRGRVRYYTRAQLRRLALIQYLHDRALVSLADTARLLEPIPDGQEPTGRAVVTASVAALAERIQQLCQAKDVLEHLLSCPTKDPVRQCSLLREELERGIDAMFAAGAPPAQSRRRSRPVPAAPAGASKRGAPRSKRTP